MLEEAWRTLEPCFEKQIGAKPAANTTKEGTTNQSCILDLDDDDDDDEEIDITGKILFLKTSLLSIY